jgi:hypothetical protein
MIVNWEFTNCIELIIIIREKRRFDGTYLRFVVARICRL